MLNRVAELFMNRFPAHFRRTGVVGANLGLKSQINYGRIQFDPLGLDDFLGLNIPPREMLVSPILPEKSLAMLYARRGLGKSWLGLSIGLAVASGSPVLRWSCPKARKVLYVDGEMVLPDLQSRLALISAGLDKEIPQGKFRILAADHTERGINLGGSEGQQALEDLLPGTDLVILDNLSTLLANGSENASEGWLPMQNWLLHLRRKGVAFLLIHHAGVNGKQRGTSRREDALDAVIALRRPSDYSPEQGARFEVHFEKLRGYAGDGATPFEATAQSVVTNSGKLGIRWVTCDLKSELLDQAAKLYAAGHTVREPSTLDERIAAAFANSEGAMPFAELRRSCRVRATTLYERLAALTAAGRVAKTNQGYYLTDS
jgi:putative DNA primase/helicase